MLFALHNHMYLLMFIPSKSDDFILYTRFVSWLRRQMEKTT